jgi:hypothetical protein
MAVAAGRDPQVASLWPELAGVAVTGFAFRRLARELERLPVPRFAVRGVVALGGTRAVAEILRKRLR